MKYDLKQQWQFRDMRNQDVDSSQIEGAGRTEALTSDQSAESVQTAGDSGTCSSMQALEREDNHNLELFQQEQDRLKQQIIRRGKVIFRTRKYLDDKKK